MAIFGQALEEFIVLSKIKVAVQSRTREFDARIELACMFTLRDKLL